MKRFKWSLQRVYDVTLQRERIRRGELLRLSREIAGLRHKILLRRNVLQRLLADLAGREFPERLPEQEVFLRCSATDERALVDLGKADKALPLLVKELEGVDKRAAVRAARALQMLGEKARAALPAMQQALKSAARGRGDPPMFIRFALTPAVKALTKRK